MKIEILRLFEGIKIVSKVVKSDMKDYEKELAFHDYLVNNAQYDKRLFITYGNFSWSCYSDDINNLEYISINLN